MGCGMTDDEGGEIVPFPVRQRGAGKPARNLGLTKLARLLGPRGEGATGHWCSRCQGLWYGRLAEVECPACGNRHG